MTRADVIKFARQAGMGGYITDVVCTLDELERFAALVATAEREACAKMCEAIYPHSGFHPGLRKSAANCATAIRARKDTP